MLAIKLFLGFVLTILGLVYFFHPTLVLRLNAWMRETVFRDSYVLFNNRRIGAILLLAGFLIMVFYLKTLP